MTEHDEPTAGEEFDDLMLNTTRGVERECYIKANAVSVVAGLEAKIERQRCELQKLNQRVQAHQAERDRLREAIRALVAVMNNGRSPSLHSVSCYLRDSDGFAIKKNGEFVFDCHCWLKDRAAALAIPAVRAVLEEKAR